MDVAPIGDINSIVSKLPDKVALVPVGVPGALGVTKPRTDVPKVVEVVSNNLYVSVPVLSPYPPSENEIVYPPDFPLAIAYS